MKTFKKEIDQKIIPSVVLPRRGLRPDLDNRAYIYTKHKTRNYYRKEVLPNRNFTLEAANRKLEKTSMTLMNTSASK